VKINDSKNNAVNLGFDKLSVEKVGEKSGASASNKTSSTSSSDDNVTLSPLAQQLQSMQAKIGTEGVFDAEKVNEIKAAIMRGDFKIDTEKVADGLIQSVKDILGNKS
jgi:negative regulator of flagellin synthesis FlgM